MPRPRAQLDPAAITAAFAADGLHGTTSDQLARRARVAKPTMYARGGTKEALFLGGVEGEVERLLSDLADADLNTRESPAHARIAALAHAIIDHGRTHPEAARLLHQTARHSSSLVAADVDAALARLPVRLASILRRDTTASCADRIAPALFGAAAALALAHARAVDSDRDATLLGDAFATVLEPAGDRSAPDRVRDVGLY
jgi:AcrR family transcriptional regulator